ATQLLALAHDRQDLLRHHGVCARLAGVATEDAVSTIVAAQIRERNEHLPRVRNDCWFKPLFQFFREGKQHRKLSVRRAQKNTCILASERVAFADVLQQAAGVKLCRGRHEVSKTIKKTALDLEFHKPINCSTLDFVNNSGAT